MGKKWKWIGLTIGLLAVAAVAIASTYATAIYMVQGGAEMVCGSGGVIDIESGGEIEIDSGGTITFLERDMCVTTGIESITGNASIATGLTTMNSASAIAETIGATAGYPFICSYSISSGTLTVYLWQVDGTAATVGSDVAWIAVGK